MKLVPRILFVFVLFSFVLLPQEKITLDRAFGGEFSGEFFRPVKWAEEGHLFYKMDDSADGTYIFKEDIKTGEKKLLVTSKQLIPEGKSTPLPLKEYKFSPSGKWMLIYTNTKKVWRVNSKGDYWVLNLETGKLRKLGGPGAKPSTLQFAKFDPTETYAAFVMEHNLYAENLETGAIKQLTFDGSRTIINGTFDWVYEEEFGIRDGFRWSPDGKMIAFWQLDASGVRDFLMINNTDSLYSYTIPVQYPKAGETNSACRVGTVDIFTEEITWINIEGDPRNNYIPRMEWAGKTGKLALQHLNRLQTEMSVFLADPRTGEVERLYNERQNAWIEVVDDWKFVHNDSHLFWVSDKDGFNQLYLISLKDGKMTNLLDGKYDAMEVVKVVEATGTVYFYASPENATQKYLYAASLNKEYDPVRITPKEFKGTNSYSISADGKFAYHTYSAINSPNKVALVELPDHDLVKQETTNAKLAEKLKTAGYNYELFTVTTKAGISVDGWMTKPYNFDPAKKYPVLFYVYNEPASTTVNDKFDGFFGLYHRAIADLGFVVVSVDGRGTPAPKGREWRKSIYQKIGVISSEDQAGALEALLSQHNYLDANKVGIWGWSGGGSMTLNMLFRYPKMYHFGISVAPVTDLRFYDSIYEERYMGLPQQNPEAYKLCSPVTFADKLEGRLFLIHGTGDDNVHFQNAEYLVDKLVAAGKQFRYMPYPNRSHGISEGKGTTMHLFKSMIAFFEEELNRK